MVAPPLELAAFLASAISIEARLTVRRVIGPTPARGLVAVISRHARLLTVALSFLMDAGSILTRAGSDKGRPAKGAVLPAVLRVHRRVRQEPAGERARALVSRQRVSASMPAAGSTSIAM